MRSRWLAVLALVATPLSAQTTVETGGGMARLDHYSGGAFSSFRGQVFQRYGALQLAFMNTAVEHRGLGTAYQTNLNVNTTFALGNWQLKAGPQMQLARGVEMPGTRTLGANLGVQRDLGAFRINGEYQRGVAWFGNKRNSWSVSEAGVATRVKGIRVGGTFSALAMTDSVPRTDVSFDLRDPHLDTLYRERVQYSQDLGLSLGWQLGRVSFSGQYGTRFGSSVESRFWWVGDVAVRVASSLAITLNSSQRASDPLLRLHGGQFASLGLRLGGIGGNGGNKPRAAVDALAFEVTRSSAKMVTLRFAIPGARESAIISGEFSGWQPIALKRMEDGRWETSIEATPGLYRVNIRSDGGPWSVPPGLRSVDDDFGGKVGLLLITR